MLSDVCALVVDDSEINLIVAQELLHSLAAKADIAGGGTIAAEMCKLRRYDIILMDHLMPEMDGIEAAKLIRSITDTPIVAMTANEDADAKALFLDNGFSGFLQKPVEAKELSELIGSIMRKKKSVEKPLGITNLGDVLHKEDSGFACKRTALTLPEIAAETGLDVRTAVHKLVGKESTYISLLQLFEQTGPEKLELLENALASGMWNDFLITIHGQKGALANIGAMSLSEKARVIEKAVKEGNTGVVTGLFDDFCLYFKSLCGKLSALWPPDPLILREATEQDWGALGKTLSQIQGHIEFLEQEEALEALEPLMGINFSEQIVSELTSLKKAMNVYDYEKAAALLGTIKKGGST